MSLRMFSSLPNGTTIYPRPRPDVKGIKISDHEIQWNSHIPNQSYVLGGYKREILCSKEDISKCYFMYQLEKSVSIEDDPEYSELFI